MMIENIRNEYGSAGLKSALNAMETIVTAIMSITILADRTVVFASEMSVMSQH